MEFLAEYGLFVAKFATVVVLLAGAAIAIVVLVGHARSGHADQIEVKHLNRKYETMSLALKSVVSTPKAYKLAVKNLHKADKQRAALPDAESRRRIFVCRFRGDVRASAAGPLAEEITAILTIARPQDEVVAVIDSSGGTIHGYGLAASQLKRVRDHGIPLVAAVDKVAASGGYMMACVANRILAAPFAVIGSIGVVAQLPNFNRFLKKHNVDFEQITAGRYKRTLSVFGENTEEGRAKVREEIGEAHDLFKAFIHSHRPQVDTETVATGEYWFGTRALELRLVDELRTSDDYLTSLAASADIYEVRFQQKRHWYERLSAGAGSAWKSLTAASPL